MKRTFAVIVGSLALFLSGTLVLASAHHGPEVINIDKVQKSMAPVEFQHAKHQDRLNGGCIQCHHTDKEGETALKPCSECHGKDEAAPSYKDALHKKCQGCHKEQKAEGKNPPIKCAECHVKK